MKTALVTGATGFVGINLCHQLHEAGWQVHIIHRPDSRLDDLKSLPLVKSIADICDYPALVDAIPEGCDAVFHVAASTNLWTANNRQQRRVNVDGTANIIAACKQKNVGRLLYTSSFAVWGFQDHVFNELDPWVDAGSWINYIKTKREAEMLVKNACKRQQLDAVILNPGNILGAYDRHNWSRLIQLIDTGKLPGIPPASGSFADVNEVARAHITAYTKGLCGKNYILGGVSANFLQFSQNVAKILGRKIPQKETPAALVRLSGRLNQWLSLITSKEPEVTPEGAAIVCNNLLADSSKAIEILGYKQTPLDDMLRETISWMAIEGMLKQP